MKKLLVFLLIFASTCWSANLLTRSDLLTATRNILDEPTVGFWSDAQLNQYIQDACNWLVNVQFVTIEKFDTIVRSTDTYLYNLNSDFLQVATVWRKADIQITPCQQVRPDSFWAINIKYGDTLKIYYALFGNDSLASTTPKIVFRPTPEETDTVFIWYYAKPRFLDTTTTATNIGQPQRTIIPYLAAWFALAQTDRDASKVERILLPVIGRLPEKKTELLGR